MNPWILRSLVLLVSILGVVTSVGAPVLAAQASATVVEDAAPIQEGTPVAEGGRAIVLGSYFSVNDASYGIQAPYSNRPDVVSPGSPDVAISGNVVLRGDGTVAQAESSFTSLRAAPDGLRYVAVAGENGNAFGLLSDGSVAPLSEQTDLHEWAQAQLPPADGAYTAIAFGNRLYSLRDDGVIVTESDAMCPDVWSPPVGLRYTAISAAHDRWAAVRSDGAVVTCGYRYSDRERLQGTLPGPLTAEIHTDDRGFVSVDAANPYVLAGRADGPLETFAVDAPEPPSVPAGRTVVSMAAGLSTIVAVLDDGSLATSGAPLEMASIPEGADRFAAATADQFGFIRVIWKRDLVDVDLTVRPVGDVAFGSPIALEVTVTSVEGFVPIGWICVRGRGCGAEVANERRTVTVTLPPPDSAGDHRYELRLVSPTTGVASASTTVRVLPRRSIGLTIDGPREWTTYDTGVKFDVGLLLAEGQEFEDVRVHEEGNIAVLADCGPPEDPWLILERIEVHAPTLRYAASMVTDTCPAGDHELRARFTPAAGVDAAETEVSFGTVRVKTTARVTSWPSEMAYDRDHLHRVEISSHEGQVFHPGTVVVRWKGQVVGTQRATAEGYQHISLEGSLLTPGTGELEVDYRSDDGLASGADVSTVVVAPAQYSGSPTPTIPATIRVGQTVKVTAATPPAGTKVSYQWCLEAGEPGAADGPVAGATGATWTVPATALGAQVWVYVTWSREHYRTKTWFAATPGAVLPGAFTPVVPSISGTAKVGKVLSATRGSWAPTPTSVTYVWKAGTTTLKSGSASWLTVPAAARGKRITVTVVGRRTAYTTTSVTSSPTAVTVAGTFSASRPRVLGTARVGLVLRVDRGTWTPAPTSVRYVWKIAGKTYRTTTSNRLTVPRSARGRRITATVVGARSGYATKRTTSSPTAIVR